MYAPPSEDNSQYQTKLIVNVVVAVFLILGLLIVLQYFNFIYLNDVPAVGGWLMDVYEQLFGAPRILILHGDDSVGDWMKLRNELSQRLIFYSEDIDINKYSAGMGDRLKKYGLVIIEDAKRIDKGKMLNIETYIKEGGNVIWVGDAGVEGIVKYNDNVLETQSGWVRPIVCIDEKTLKSCDCKKVTAPNSTCKYLPDEAERKPVDMTKLLGVVYIDIIKGSPTQLEIVDRRHWAAAGINRTINLADVNEAGAVSNSYSSTLVANLHIGSKTIPAVVVKDGPGAWGKVAYFAYPPEETMELFLPIVERLRY